MGLEDRLNEIKKDVIDHMNNDHSDANLAYVKGLSEGERTPDRFTWC